MKQQARIWIEELGTPAMAASKLAKRNSSWDPRAVNTASIPS